MAMRDIPFAPSGNIADIQHDDETQTLYVRFRSGRAGRYLQVTGDEADGFSQALSANQYLQVMIVPGHKYEPVGSQDIPAGL